MLSRICAGWLVLLILLPFSAPFSTCDLTLFLGGRHGTTHPVDAVSPITQASAVQHTTTHALPRTRSAHRHQWLLSDGDLPLPAAIRPLARVPRHVTPTTFACLPILQPLRI